MEAYKILREIRTLAPDWFKIPYLIPMTDTIERCRQYVDSENDSGSAFRIIELTDQLQQIELDAGLFIAMENGKPSIRPAHIAGWFRAKNLPDPWEAYREAQDEVIFDGWERMNPESDRLYIHNVEASVGLEFSEGTEGCKFFNLRCPSDSIQMENIEDLAKATSDNPLDLK